MSTVIEQFIAHFVAERKKLGLTQANAAEKCGVSLKMWGNYERGEHVPTGEVLLKFQEAGANVAQMFAFNQAQQLHKQYIADSDLADLIHAYEIGDESEKKALTTLAGLIIKNKKN
ncbi:helix-turn-helix domain-containing protein [Methylophilus sp. 3sh_L]|uniref:helix-turn-helix domain-containing protein n=1 Tax=Methylophilus sp. 3sh_L TaxID=3377114 RepID=UPI00398F4C05